jgi:PIN domain nuclease of toxin-antitoxin system
MIVVDTHVLVWLADRPEQISDRATKALVEARREGTLAIAAVTLREIAWLISRGRVTVRSTPLEYLQFVEARTRVIAMDARIAWQSMEFGPSYSRDPADREIGATAVVHGAKLVTKDKLIRESGEVECIW